MTTPKQALHSIARTLLENWVIKNGNHSMLSANICFRPTNTKDNPAYGVLGKILSNDKINNPEKGDISKIVLAQKDTFFKKNYETSLNKLNELRTYRSMLLHHLNQSSIQKLIFLDSAYPGIADIGNCSEKCNILALEIAQYLAEGKKDIIDSANADVYLNTGHNFDHVFLILATPGSYDVTHIENNPINFSLFDRNHTHIVDPWLMSHFSLENAPIFWRDMLVADSYTPNTVVQAYPKNHEKDKLDYSQHPFWTELWFSPFNITAELYLNALEQNHTTDEEIQMIKEAIEKHKRQTELDYPSAEDIEYYFKL